MSGKNQHPPMHSVMQEYVYLPSRAGRAAVEEFQRRAHTKLKVEWGVPTLDNYLVPMMPGDLISLVGRPGHAKTSLMIHLARQTNHMLMQLHALGRPEHDHHVVYATWETLIEEAVALSIAPHSGYSLETIGRGLAAIPPLQRAIGATVDQRIAIFGRSMVTSNGLVPTIEGLDIALTEMRQGGINPCLVLVDYLQRIPGDYRVERGQQVSENLERLKDLALRHRVPVVVGIQARRDVDEYRGLKFPRLNDGQWSSNIEQTSDKVISLTRPSVYMQLGDDIEIGGKSYKVSHRTMGLQVVKARWGPAGESFILDLDPGKAVLSEAAPIASPY